MSKKVFFKQANIESWDRHLTQATGGLTYAGDMLAGTFNGLCTGFMSDLLIPDAVAATLAVDRYVAAAGGGDLATPVAYWFRGHPLRLRCGTTTAAAIAASTTGIVTTSTRQTNGRGILRMQLADVIAAAQILLDQGNLSPIPMTKSWILSIHVSSSLNGDLIPVAAGSAEFGIIGGALGVDPTAVMNAAGMHFAISDNQLRAYSVATTATLLGTKVLPTGDYVMKFDYDANSRTCWLSVDNKPWVSYVFPGAVTACQIAGRVMHQAAYVVATHDPLGVDLDGIIWYCPNV
jgi:hypothetical protein